MRDERAETAASDLQGDVRQRLGTRERAAPGHDQADGGVEMGPRYRAEDRDEHHQDRASGDCVGKQRDGHVAAREPRSHDARADHGRHQQTGAERFGRQATADIVRHVLPLPTFPAIARAKLEGGLAPHRISGCGGPPRR